jgi:hypothetical protein
VELDRKMSTPGRTISAEDSLAERQVPAVAGHDLNPVRGLIAGTGLEGWS